MFQTIRGFFQRRKFSLTQSEHSRVKQMPAELQVAELMFQEALRSGQIKFNTLQERSKGRQAWQMSWMACTEYLKVRK